MLCPTCGSKLKYMTQGHLKTSKHLKITNDLLTEERIINYEIKKLMERKKKVKEKYEEFNKYNLAYLYRQFERELQLQQKLLQ
tara:strand:- start:660 stop:908 length:249 start_codon:yes stop_codon:yes gene_type:complete